jgi:hypothetical protein
VQGERSAIPPALGGILEPIVISDQERLFLTTRESNEQGTIDMPHLDHGARKNQHDLFHHG